MAASLNYDAQGGEILNRIRRERPPMAMKAVYRKDAPPGSAGRAFIEQLRR